MSRDNLVTGWIGGSNGPGSVSGWLCGHEAEYMETLSEEQIGKQCVNAIRQFTKRAWPNIPKLKRVIP